MQATPLLCKCLTCSAVCGIKLPTVHKTPSPRSSRMGTPDDELAVAVIRHGGHSSASAELPHTTFSSAAARAMTRKAS
jgi:hypothetical protein